MSILLNLKEVFSKWYSITIFLFVFFVMMYIFLLFTNIALIKGNYGETYLFFQLCIQTLISILFGLFVSISLYKFLLFSSFSISQNITSGGSSFLSLLVAGCPSCSLTLESYLGLVSLVAFLPWYGLELKLLAIGILLYSNYSLLKKLKECKIKKS